MQSIKTENHRHSTRTLIKREPQQVLSALTTLPHCFSLMLGFARSCKIHDFSGARELRPKELAKSVRL